VSIKETRAIHSVLSQLTNGTTAGKCRSVLFNSCFSYSCVLGILGRAGKSRHSNQPPLMICYQKNQVKKMHRVLQQQVIKDVDSV